MKFMLIAATVIVPLSMYLLEQKQAKIKTLYHFIAFIALITFANIVVMKVYGIIVNGDVYTMKIHGLFLNPMFLASGAYLGVYLIYLLLLLCFNLSFIDR